MATTSVCMDNCTNAGVLYEFATDEIWAQWNALTHYFEYQPWIFSLIGSAMVGLSGILPLLVIPIDEGVDLKNGAGAETLKILLSFAVGGLLGDVFLHLLPEAWGSKALNIAHANGQRPITCGLWVLTGFLVFIIAEKMFIGEGDGEQEDVSELEESTDDANDKSQEYFNNNVHKELENNNCLTLNGRIGSKNLLTKPKYSKNTDEVDSMGSVKSRSTQTKNGYSIQTIAPSLQKNGSIKKISSVDNSHATEKDGDNKLFNRPQRLNGFVKVSSDFEDERFWEIENAKKNTRKDETTSSKISANVKPKPKHITGYLNLMANCIDNFTHGLAVGGSFLVSFRLGALTTFAILIHEIPHEVGDFAILLKSGFNRWDAARAQLLTASGGIFGALVAVLCSGSGIESRTSWILPFTAGGFLHIGMVTVLPELLKEMNPKESMKQLGALLSGITVMAILTILCD